MDNNGDIHAETPHQHSLDLDESAYAESRSRSSKTA